MNDGEWTGPLAALGRIREAILAGAHGEELLAIVDAEMTAYTSATGPPLPRKPRRR